MIMGGPFRVPVPFLREQVAAGDFVRGVTDRLHIPSCGRCQERQDALNRMLVFGPEEGTPEGEGRVKNWWER
jgi:hypothetical protein